VKKLLYLIVASLLVLGLVLVGFGCTTPSEQEEEEEEAPTSIKIGALLSLSGFDAGSGGPILQGYELGVADINKDGGVYVEEFGKKIPLELVVADGESDAAKTVERAEYLNTENVLVVCTATMGVSAVDVFEVDKLPAVTILIHNSYLWEQGREYLFNLGKTNPLTVDSLYEVFSNVPEMSSNWALWELQQDWVAELFDFAESKAPDYGIDYVYHGTYAMLSPDMTPLVQGAKDAGAEVVFCNGPFPDDITLLATMAQLDYKPKGIIMVEGADDPAWGEALGPLGAYVVASPEWHPAMDFPGVAELNAEYEAEYGTVTHHNAGSAYACIQVVADAIERAGTLDREAIRDALATTDMMTVTGQIELDETGKRIGGLHTVTQWVDGVMTLVWPDNLKTEPLIYPIPWD
jgi:branched-chain amino acid transport system substrate-binding protein